MATTGEGTDFGKNTEKDAKNGLNMEEQSLNSKDKSSTLEEKPEIFHDTEESTKETDLCSDSDSDAFEDAKDDTGLNENMNKCNIEDNEKEENKEEISDDEYVEPEEDLTPEQKEERKQEAQEFKNRGNEYFRNKEYPEAKEFYTRAIQTCPSEYSSNKAIYYSNRAACLVMMEFQKDAIKDCTKALELNPDYIKARLRRAQCHEHTDQLEEALEDYKIVFEADKSCHIAREALMRLPEQIKIKHEKMKEEMLGKLKDLGNVFLKPFGMSTENFKLQQDPNTGGYSVNFQK